MIVNETEILESTAFVFLVSMPFPGIQKVNISCLYLSPSSDSLDLYQANTLPACKLGFLFESKGEMQLECVYKSFADLQKKNKTKTIFMHYIFTKPHSIWPEQIVLECEQDKQMQGTKWWFPWLQLCFWWKCVRIPVRGQCKFFRTLPCPCWSYIKALQCRSTVSLSEPDSFGMFTQTARLHS